MDFMMDDGSNSSAVDADWISTMYESMYDFTREMGLKKVIARAGAEAVVWVLIGEERRGGCSLEERKRERDLFQIYVVSPTARTYTTKCWAIGMAIKSNAIAFWGVLLWFDQARYR